MNHVRDRSIRDHISLLESQYACIAAMEIAIDDSTKVAILLRTLQELAKYELLITSILMMR